MLFRSLPRLAVMLDKAFGIVGLNGKAVLPLVLGLGCDTMATMTARILSSHKERILVIFLLALGIPCSAQLGVILAIMATLSFKAMLLWMASIIIVIIIVGAIASRAIPGQTSDFIIEIPAIRKPEPKNILLKTFSRTEWYLREAVPLFILGTAVLWILDRVHGLFYIEKIMSPVVVSLLGLPDRKSTRLNSSH